jgi:hypothetical protein
MNEVGGQNFCPGRWRKGKPPSLYVFTHLVNESVAFLYWQPTKLGWPTTNRSTYSNEVEYFVIFKISFKNEETCFIHFSNEILDGPDNKKFAANRCPDDDQIYAKRVSVSGAPGMRTIGVQFASAKENISEAHGRWCCPCPLNRSVTDETDVADSLITRSFVLRVISRRNWLS